jgi:hypothetical protein
VFLTPSPPRTRSRSNSPKQARRREGTAAYHSPLTSYVALWAFRGVGCAPKSGGLRTPAVLVSPSGPLRVLGGAAVRWLTHAGREVPPSGLLGCWGGRNPVAYAHRQRSAALRAKTKQPEQA